MTKKVIGLVEKVRIRGEKHVESFALFDTGAKRTSIDPRLAKKANLGPVISTVKLRHASLKKEIQRPVVRAIIDIKGTLFDVKVSVQDRAHMSFPMIVGRDILSGNFIVDPERNKELFNRKKLTDQVNLTKYAAEQ